MKVVLLVKLPSLTVRVTFADPLLFVTGVSVTVQLGKVPPRTIPELASFAIFEEDAETEAQVSVLSMSLIVKAIGDVVAF